MLRSALVFFVIAMLAYVLGATGVAGVSLEIGRVLLVIFLVLTILGVATGLLQGDKDAA